MGDIEGLPFLEAVRQFRNEVGRENAIFINPDAGAFYKDRWRGEDKTHPAQRQGPARDRHTT